MSIIQLTTQARFWENHRIVCSRCKPGPTRSLVHVVSLRSGICRIWHSQRDRRIWDVDRTGQKPPI